MKQLVNYDGRIYLCKARELIAGLFYIEVYGEPEIATVWWIFTDMRRPLIYSTRWDNISFAIANLEGFQINIPEALHQMDTWNALVRNVRKDSSNPEILVIKSTK